MGRFSGGSSAFNELLEKATSQLLLEPEWSFILQLCDCIRQQDVTPKYALGAIKNRISDPNPHVSLFALTVLEACVKNCGSPFHAEVASKQFMDDLRVFVKNCPEPSKEKALGLIQAWSSAFRSDPKYKVVQDTFNLMKMEGCKFPTYNESDAMFSAERAPEWAEGHVCHMCRVKFGVVQRQHHCRSCGQVFCGKCSSKASIIPQYGIEREVRVCDPCYYKLNPGSKPSESEKDSKTSVSGDPDLPAEYLNSPLSSENQAPVSKSDQEVQEQEEEELQLAMALSISQDETAKEQRIRGSPRSSSHGSSSSSSPYSSQSSNSVYSTAMSELDVSDGAMDPELAHYLNRSYWEERSERASPTAPAEITSRTSAANSLANHTPRVSGVKAKKKKEKKRRENSENLARNTMNETDEQYVEGSEVLVQNFRDSVNMLMERMQSISSKGKHIAMDATVQSLFQTVSAMHPQLLRLIEEREECTEKYKGLQEKLGLVREARSTLEDMREQHREKVRQQELEQDMLRRIQIEQKLELMRQQKADYLAYQQRLQTERQALEQQQLMQQQQQQQQQVQYQKQMYGAPPHGDTSPYSSLNYVPAVSAAALPQASPQAYTQHPQVQQRIPGMYTPPEAPVPSQYAPRAQALTAHQLSAPPEGSYVPRASDYIAYGTEQPPIEPPPPSLGPHPSLDYQLAPMAYPSQTPQQLQQEVPVPAQSYTPATISQTPVAPRQQVHPQQYRQVTVQHGQGAGHMYPVPAQQPRPSSVDVSGPAVVPTQEAAVLPSPMQQHGSVAPPQGPSYEAAQQLLPQNYPQPPPQLAPQQALPTQQQYQQPQHQQQPPPPQHQQALPTQEQQQHYQQPQHQHQQPPPQLPIQQQHYQQPHHQQAPPPPQQQQQLIPPHHPPPPQYHEAVPPHYQQSGPPPQRQLSDLELISFD